MLSDLDKPITRMSNDLVDLHDNLKSLCSVLASGCITSDLCSGTERLEIIRWISTVPYREHHENIRQDRLPGSGAWLLKSPNHVEWRASSYSSILWLHGIRKSCTVHWRSKTLPNITTTSWLREEHPGVRKNKLIHLTFISQINT